MPGSAALSHVGCVGRISRVGGDHPASNDDVARASAPDDRAAPALRPIDRARRALVVGAAGALVIAALAAASWPVRQGVVVPRGSLSHVQPGTR